MGETYNSKAKHGASQERDTSVSTQYQILLNAYSAYQSVYKNTITPPTRTHNMGGSQNILVISK